MWEMEDILRMIRAKGKHIEKVKSRNEKENTFESDGIKRNRD